MRISKRLREFIAGWKEDWEREEPFKKGLYVIIMTVFALMMGAIAWGFTPSGKAYVAASAKSAEVARQTGIEQFAYQSIQPMMYVKQESSGLCYGVLVKLVHEQPAGEHPELHGVISVDCETVKNLLVSPK